MMRARLTLAALAALALAACEPVPAPVPPPVEPDECGASGYQGLVGQPKTVLDGMKFPIATRVIGPDDAVTADYNPKRLNIEYGRTGLIDKVSCY